MKNEQQNNQNGKQDQSVNKTGITTEREQQKKKDDWINKSTGKNQPLPDTNQSSNQSQGKSGNEKSNIGVDNDGKIGKAHDQWNNDNDNRNNDAQKQARNDKKVTEPEIDAPIYDPEKTEKKIPQMGNNNEKK